MKKIKILIATTNEHKFREMSYVLGTFPFIDLLSLRDIKKKILEPVEDKDTLAGNALLKAQYYAEKTGLTTIADDTGMFIDALGGWPGVVSARIADTDKERRELVLEKMKNKKNRDASFRCVLAFHDPAIQSSLLSFGECKGKILDHATGASFTYDPIFYVPVYSKTYSEMTMNEKNEISHRGKALIKIKYYIQNQYGTKHIVVPFGLVVKNGKILLIKRNDPHRPEYHGKWEFPGGSVEYGETVHANVVREVYEETGYKVKVVKILQHIATDKQSYPTYKYQVYLIPHVCEIIGGKGKPSDAENMGQEFVDLDKVINYDLIGNDKKMFKKFLPELKKVIKENNL